MDVTVKSSGFYILNSIVTPLSTMWGSKNNRAELSCNFASPRGGEVPGRCAVDGGLIAGGRPGQI